MKIALMMVALLVLAGPAVAGPQQFTWVLPHGADASAVAAHMSRDKDLWLEGEDAQAWAEAFANSVKVSTRANRIDWWLHVPEGADVEVLDQFVAACYHRYRMERLPVLPSLIDLNRTEIREEGREAGAIRAELLGLLISGAGVVDRDKTLAASAARCEDLRRRVVDARIEGAVLEARIRAVRMQVKARRAHLANVQAERIAAMEADLDRRIERSELAPSSRKLGEHREAIEAFRRQPIAEDDLNESLIRTAADLEVDQIGTDELVRVLEKSLEEEKRRSLELLDAQSLEQLRKSRLAPVERRIRQLTVKGSALERELLAVRSLVTVRRVTVDPDTGELPRYYIVGAVRAPGMHRVDGKLTLTQLIARAGDLAEDADERRIRILRREGTETGLVKIDLIDVIGLKIEDPELRPGDLVSVPEDGDKRELLPRAAVDPETGMPQHVFVWGVVAGAFVLEEGMTLMRLIKVIGYRGVIDLENVRIIRKGSDGKEVSIPVDGKALNVRIVPKDKDPVLKADDVIVLLEKK